MQPIFVGDVQGCAEELEEILARARARFGTGFELWAVGDLVNRGPYSLRVLRAVRELAEAGRARCVLGNHEITLLRTALGLRARSPEDRFDDVLEDPEADDWIDWLLTRPLVAPGVLAAQPFAMVHAAAHPDWTLPELVERADRAAARLASGRGAARAFLSGPRGGEADGDRDVLERLVSCRSVDGPLWWSAPPTGAAQPWHAAWSRRGHDYGVVYGHWSLQGLHVAPGLRGLDTGCVHHGRSGDRALTAWVPDLRRETPFGVPDERFWRVPARRSYYAGPRAR